MTVAQWAAFVQAAKFNTDDDQKKLIGTKDKQNHPMVYVSWDDAQEFCRWLNTTPALKALPSGLQFCLPTEDEWEKAARGMDGRIYPWGNEWDAGRCNTSESKIGDTTPVGQYSPKGDSPFGLQDMAGNVWEWCQSKYYRFYPYMRFLHGVDQSGDARVVRGGAWNGNSGIARAAYRNWNPPVDRRNNYGFRVCAHPPSR